jgi:hypothetical protein
MRFVAWIQGTGGSFGNCYCEFEWTQAWDLSKVGQPGTPDGRTGANVPTLVSGQNCSIP